MKFRVFWMFLVAETISSPAKGNHCASVKQCRCESVHHDVIANCAGLNLTHSPKFLDSVTIVYLNNNFLKNLPSHLPKFLKKIDLSENAIEKLTSEEFKDIENLQDLNLQHNNLTLDYTNFQPKLFINLKKLKRINLKQNQNCDSYLDHALQDLVSLEILEMNGQLSSSFGPKFGSLRALSKLDLSDSDDDYPRTCKLQTISAQFFKYLPHLQYLDISKCNLSFIENGAISSLKHLQYLDISNNMLTFDIMHGITLELQFTKIKNFKANQINCDIGSGIVLEEQHLINLLHTNLSELSLSNNRIDYLMNARLPKTTEYLNLSGNRINYRTNFKKLDLFKYVRTLDIQHQFYIEPHTGIKTMPMCHVLPKNCSAGLLQGNITASPHPLTANEVITTPEGVQTLYYNYSGICGLLKDWNFMTNELRHLYMDHNSLHKWIGSVENMTNLETLDLSANFCNEVDLDFFSSFPNLKKLNISQNFLGVVFEKLTANYEKMFVKQTKLEHLDLSENRIRCLPKHFFQYLTNLETLKLHQNLIHYIEFDVHYMTRLSEFDISNNEIQFLSDNNMNQFQEIPHIQKLSLILSGNPFQCSCDSKNFLTWIQKHVNEVKIKNMQTIRCRLQSTDVTYHFSNLTRLIDLIEKECASYTLMIVCIVAIITIMIISIAIGIIYRYRWKLQYLFYMTKTRYLTYSRLDNKTLVYKYDAFISYANENRKFIMEGMLENLKEFQLCIHSRDFVPGKEIAENITDAIHNSRLTVCVISPQYLNSYWCMFELNMARMESFYSRSNENVIFLIIYQPPSNRDIPLPLLHLMDQKSYLEYLDDPQGKIAFWSQLRETLSD